MKKLIFYCLFVSSLIITPLMSEAQSNYEPVHGVTGYDYKIKGELELTFTNSIDFKNGTKSEGTYLIKSPVLLMFNLNDLKFFKASPNEFIGYVENQYNSRDGYPGGLIDIPEGGYMEEENWMWVDEHVKWWENGELTEIKSHGEIFPVLKVDFSIPDYPEKYKAGLEQLRFRITISGISDSHFHPTRDVVVEYNNKSSNTRETKTDLIDEETLNKLELADPTAAAEIKKAAGLLLHSSDALLINVKCGSFYGQDLVNALMANNLLEADKARKETFEHRFEQVYFKDMPQINVMKLIDYLIKPSGNYETPVSGSFSSDSEYGSEKATYKGTLKLWRAQIRKDE